jgi:anti-sigma28 factor (negative regulator of flagellin synthesis)
MVESGRLLPMLFPQETKERAGTGRVGTERGSGPVSGCLDGTRWERVARIRVLLASGGYQVPASALAAAMLRRTAAAAG